jgi:hypothetical protein
MHKTKKHGMVIKKEFVHSSILGSIGVLGHYGTAQIFHYDDKGETKSLINSHLALISGPSTFVKSRFS